MQGYQLHPHRKRLNIPKHHYQSDIKSSSSTSLDLESNNLMPPSHDPPPPGNPVQLARNLPPTRLPQEPTDSPSLPPHCC
ncbi:hypothetical protein K469DRAFT_704933 [Zopfia rhizophila CBS 207.26]|uniref:Uncharacterized protein n=1 Tax=Zopfia rhizophila CBS 207.26 TaxID=1314779 RepID=A0A6A6E8B0_9PEZI|nr:hypothetical protein K469DRAFT_704933 [Zopfia rhizophila CBS 207.26]